MAGGELEPKTRAHDDPIPRRDGQGGHLIEVDAADFGKVTGIARITSDFGVIVVHLCVDQETDLVECLLDPETPASDLGLGERAPDFKLIGQEIGAQQFANVEVSVNAEVAIDRRVPVGKPHLADAGLYVAKIRGGCATMLLSSSSRCAPDSVT
jgi:hypothetical protein